MHTWKKLEHTSPVHMHACDSALPFPLSSQPPEKDNWAHQNTALSSRTVRSIPCA